jgi:HEPN domain-containing protein
MLRKHSDETDPADWFYLAADRLKAVDILRREEGLTPSCIELLHEAVERFLKGYLVAQGGTDPTDSSRLLRHLASIPDFLMP